jgi:hypothetical protein
MTLDHPSMTGGRELYFGIEEFGTRCFLILEDSSGKRVDVNRIKDPTHSLNKNLPNAYAAANLP